MHPIRRLCVYCGSSSGVDTAYREAAQELGRELARAGLELVYGGGRVGLMGVLADAALGAGGSVVGVIPARVFEAEVAHPGLSELVVVANMHERKRGMVERADAFAVLPGGIGTLDETVEVLSWRQLGLHDKPVFVIDLGGYWRPLLALLDHMVANGFLRPEVRAVVQVVSSVPDLLAALSRTHVADRMRATAPL
jgi:uncharacterized protein (TIGR00730 family)